MSVKLVTQNVYRCKCCKCDYEWDAFTMPARCARCKIRRWNEGADRRFKDPYANAKVPLEFQIESGKGVPRLPRMKDILDLFLKTRKVYDEMIQDNPCDHDNDRCFCAEKRTLVDIDRMILRLRKVTGTKEEVLDGDAVQS